MKFQVRGLVAKILVGAKELEKSKPENISASKLKEIKELEKTDKKVKYEMVYEKYSETVTINPKNGEITVDSPVLGDEKNTTCMIYYQMLIN